MAKLHIYEKFQKSWSKVANGDGTIDKTESFDVVLTSGTSSVSSGNTYQIRQGTSVDGTLCDCTAVNDDTATFKVSSSQALVAQGVESVQLRLMNFYAALDAVNKNVEIVIDLDDLTFLKTNNYALCFAKKVASDTGRGEYNVVWQSLKDYLYSTQFSWTPQFSLFGSNVFQKDVKVTATTNAQTVGLKEQCVLDKTGRLMPPSTGGSPTGVTLVNQYGSIHPALSQISVLNGITRVTPLYVAPYAITTGEVTLTPIETVLVWFQQNISTSTMFSSARSMSAEIDLTNTNDAVRLYKGGEWTKP